MSNEINPSYQKLIDGFTMTRTKDGKGRGVRVNIWIGAYPDGHVHLYDGSKEHPTDEGEATSGICRAQNWATGWLRHPPRGSRGSWTTSQ